MLGLMISTTLELYQVDKSYLQREACYAPLLEKQSVNWADGHSDDPDQGCVAEVFGGRDYEFEKLGSIHRVSLNDRELTQHFMQPTDMSIFTKEEVLALLERIKSASDHDDPLVSFHNDRMEQYLNAISLDEGKVIVGLINDGFDIYKHRGELGYE